MAVEGKNVGIVGGILAAIGAAFAHGADDCARAGARVGATAGDDIARPVTLAPRALGGSSDDLGRGASRLGAPAPGLADDGLRVAPAELADDGLRASPSEQVIEELGQEASLQALDLMLDDSESEEPESSEPRLTLRTLEPTLISLLPPSVPVNSPRWIGVRASSAASALGQAAGAKSEIVLVLGQVEQTAPDQLLTAEGKLGITLLEQRCARSRRRCIVLACESSAADTSVRSCPEATLEIVGRAMASSPQNESELLRYLLADRAQTNERRLTLHRLVVAGKKLRLVHSRLE